MPEAIEGTASLTCSRCGMTSYSLTDLVNNYCGNCHVFLIDSAVRAHQNQTAAELTMAAKHGYLYVRALPNDRFLVVEEKISEGAFLKLCDAEDVHGVWDYLELCYAINAAATWDPAKQKEPFGWYRHPASGRRRPFGNPIREVVYA